MLEDLLKSAMQVEPADETGMLQHAESVAEARKNLEMARTKMMVSIRKQLTTEQSTKLEGMKILSGALVIMSDNIVISNTAGGEKEYDSSNSELQMPVYERSFVFSVPSLIRIETILSLDLVMRYDSYIGF